MKKIIGLKSRPAQQLVEFLLVAPFMIIILGIVMEYAYALNINMTLTQGLKEVTSNMYYSVKPNMTTSDIVAAVQTNLENYLDDNNVATETANGLSLSYAPVGNTSVLIASYKYIPAFTLPQLYFRFLPSEFNFVAASAVPTVFMNANNYGSTKTAALDSIWSAPKGVKSTGAAHGEMLFLIPTLAPGLTNPYEIKDWNGTSQPYVVNANDGKLYSCTVTCSDSGNMFKTYYAASTNIIFVHESGAWSDLLKESLGLASSAGLTRGNYDNINVSLYNADIVDTDPTEQYIITTSGSKTFAYTSADSISNLQ